MKKKDAIDLLDKYRNGTCTEEELILLRQWFHGFNDPEAADLETIDLDNASVTIWQSIQHQREKGKLRSIVYWRYAAVAAVVVIALVTGIRIFLTGQSAQQTKPLATVQKPDTTAFEPGGEKAYLTLANGTTISLTDAANGEIAQQTGVRITKTADGQLVYTIAAATNDPNKAPEFNTISTPRGGQYQVVLPDGSRVWLNAASSLRYPAAFASNERKVTLTGEGYFEVSHNAAKPFVVQTDKQLVTVLGTQFNLNAYPETNNTITTLLTGSVRISSADSNSSNTAMLRPGQQSINDRTIKIINVDPTEAIAWKNGFLLFDNENFATIMNRIARWYDIEVVYKTSPPNLQPGGRISLSRKLPEVLAALEATGEVHFQIAGKKVTVIE